MSAMNGILWAFQGGSGAVGEWKRGDADSGTSLFTLVTPPAVPTGVDMDSYALRYTPAGSGNTMTSPSFSVGAHIVNGFWWRPETNPSSGHCDILLFDDNGGHGPVLTHKTNKKLALFSIVGTELVEATTVAPDTAEVYEGVTNPWYWIAWSADGLGTGSGNASYSIRVYKWNDNTGDADPVNNIDLIDTISYAGLTASGAWAGTVGGVANATSDGAWTMANFFVQGGSQGLYGPLAVSMRTGVPTSIQTNNTTWVLPGTSATANAAVTTATGPPAVLTDTRVGVTLPAWGLNQWAGHVMSCNGKTFTISTNTTNGVATAAAGVGWSGGGNPGNGHAYVILALDDAANEDNAISEIPPTDTLTPFGYLIKTTTAAALQRYEMTDLDAVIPAGANILGVCIKARYQAASTSATARMRIRNAGGTEKIFDAITPSAIDVWSYETFGATSVDPATLAGFSDTDIDALRVGLEALAAAGARYLSQVILTVIYGTDEPPLVPSPTETGGTSQII